PRRAPEPARRADGLCLRPALRLGRRAVSRGNAAAAARVRRPRFGLLALGGTVNAVLVEARGLAKHYAQRAGTLRALDGVALALHEGEALGLVGESGCGKSTLGRILLRLLAPTAGAVRFAGEELLALSPARLRSVRRRMQIVPQNPYASLDPR